VKKNDGDSEYPEGEDDIKGLESATNKSEAPVIILTFEKTEAFDLKAKMGLPPDEPEKKVLKEEPVIKLELDGRPSKNSSSKSNQEESKVIAGVDISFPALEKKLTLDKGRPSTKFEKKLKDPKNNIPGEELGFSSSEKKLTADSTSINLKVTPNQPQPQQQAQVQPLPKIVTPASAPEKKKIKKANVPGSGLSRIMAQIIDLSIIIIIFVLSYFLAQVILKISDSLLDDFKMKFIFSAQAMISIIHMLVFSFNVFIVFVYFLVVESTSIGKKIMGLSVISKEQEYITFKQAFLREMIFKPLSYVTFFGLFWALIDKEQKTLHDILAATNVIKSD